VRALLTAGVVVTVVLTLAPALSASDSPSERGCLLQWNAPSNAANRQRVVASGPWTRATLRAGVSANLTWKLGSVHEAHVG